MYGSRATGYSRARDQTYPTTWRVRTPDGALSDIGNSPALGTPHSASHSAA
jgi:hypothetical protein